MIILNNNAICTTTIGMIMGRINQLPKSKRENWRKRGNAAREQAKRLVLRQWIEEAGFQQS